ncbi:MAG: SMC-Scp complex subunit ScpB [Acidobacteria bacterium]|nr:SMC-Scp complex subunit ScpB [Acidobacteriota bacterium]
MSKRSRKKSSQESPETHAGEAVEVLASELSGIAADVELTSRGGDGGAAPGQEAAGDAESRAAAAAEDQKGFRIGDGTGADDISLGGDGPDEFADENVLDAEDSDEDGEDEEDSEVAIFDADAEDAAEEFARRRAEAQEAGVGEATDDEVAPGGQPRELAELMAICEALIFVSEEPLPSKTMADVLREDRGWVQVAVESLAKEFNERNSGLMLREVAGGWQIATRPEHHEHVRAYLKSKPSAKLSLPALETLAVIAYKQPVTVPEILEIRGVQSSSAIKTLLDKRLIVAKGRKETVGRPMMYGTSKDFLLQFGLKDVGELPSIEDFEDLAAGET